MKSYLPQKVYTNTNQINKTDSLSDIESNPGSLAITYWLSDLDNHQINKDPLKCVAIDVVKFGEHQLNHSNDYSKTDTENVKMHKHHKQENNINEIDTNTISHDHDHSHHHNNHRSNINYDNYQGRAEGDAESG